MFLAKHQFFIPKNWCLAKNRWDKLTLKFPTESSVNVCFYNISIPGWAIFVYIFLWIFITFYFWWIMYCVCTFETPLTFLSKRKHWILKKYCVLYSSVWIRFFLWSPMTTNLSHIQDLLWYPITLQSSCRHCEIRKLFTHKFICENGICKQHFN